LGKETNIVDFMAGIAADYVLFVTLSLRKKLSNHGKAALLIVDSLVKQCQNPPIRDHVQIPIRDRHMCHTPPEPVPDLSEYLGIPSRLAEALRESMFTASRIIGEHMILNLPWLALRLKVGHGGYGTSVGAWEL
jgi:hypothetical protein